MSKPVDEADYQRRMKDWADADRKLKEYQANQPQYITCKYLTDKAKNLKLWLYDPQIKRWFTPEEFYELFNGYDKSSTLFTRIELKNPMEGIEAANQQLESIHNRLSLFVKKIFEYYFTG